MFPLERLRILSLILFLLALMEGLSQTGNHLTCERVFEIKGTTTVIVLDDIESEYNRIMREAVEKHWKITPYKFTTESKKILFSASRDYSLLMKNQAVRVEKRVKGDFQIHFNEIALYPSYRIVENEDLHARDAYAKIRVDSLHKSETYLYKLEGLIHSMHNFLVYASQGNIRRNTYAKDMKRFLNLHASELSSKTLYITSQDLAEEYQPFMEAYEHSMKFVEKDQLEAKIRSGDPRAAFLHIHPLVSQIYVVDIATGRILYGNRTEQYKKLSIGDIENLSRAGRKREKGLKRFFR